MNPASWDRFPTGYETVESLLDDVSKQMTLANLSRYSRGGNGQRAGPIGGNMRIAKPNSASNSPRGSMGLARRRTVMADSPYRRKMAMMEQNGGVFAGFVSNDGLQIAARSNRPMSWHPSSQQAHQQPQPVYQPFAFDFNNQVQQLNFPPTPAGYSGYTSPASAFSPASMPYNGFEQDQQYYIQNVSAPCQSNALYTLSQPVMMEQQSQSFNISHPPAPDRVMYSQMDCWNNFSTHGFQTPTSPPTPEDFLPIQHPEPALPAEESIPYHPLSETEEAGEQLIGLGLYDTPEAMKSPSSDPYLDNYRSMMSQLLGSAYRRPESTGKGLKLEETWAPPDSDDDDENENDDEQDGEAEDDDEVTQDETENDTVTYPVQGAQQLNENGWV